MNEIVNFLNVLISLVKNHNANSNEIPMSTNVSIPLGIIVLAVIELPVIILLLAAIFTRPRKKKVTGLFLVWLTLMFTAFFGAFFILSRIFSLYF